MASIEEKVENLLQDKISELGYELYDVEYAKEGKNYFLRVLIDQEDGIDLDDCEKVNDGIMDLLDEADYIKDAYFLEVSSPGIERVLRKDKHLEASVGKEVVVNLFKPYEGKKSLEGTLKNFDKEKIVLENEKEEVEVDRKNIALMKTKYHWE